MAVRRAYITSKHIDVMEAVGAQNAGPKQILYENTYICNPEGYGEVGAVLQ